MKKESLKSKTIGFQNEAKERLEKEALEVIILDFIQTKLKAKELESNFKKQNQDLFARTEGYRKALSVHLNDNLEDSYKYNFQSPVGDLEIQRKVSHSYQIKDVEKLKATLVAFNLKWEDFLEEKERVIDTFLVKKQKNI